MTEAKPSDWERIYKEVSEYQSEMPLRMIQFLHKLEGCDHGFAINQFRHSLQMATRALEDGSDDELVLCALLHDVGKVMTTANHGAIIAEVLKPFISSDNYNILKYHQDFQGQYYYSIIGKDDKEYLRHKNESWFETAKKFGFWDQSSFDPAYKEKPLEDFLPILKKYLSEFPWKLKKESA